MSPRPIRVLVADDQALLRGSFRVLVESAPGLVVVGEAATGAESVELARRERPDVVLMDVRMPQLDGIEATQRICGSPETAGTRVLILTMFVLDAYVYAALRAGASGFLLKDTPPADLLAAIRLVAAGEALLAPAITRRLIQRHARGADKHRAALASLTAREIDVLMCIARGLSNSEIAPELHLGGATIKTHVSRCWTSSEFATAFRLRSSHTRPASSQGAPRDAYAPRFTRYLDPTAVAAFT